ncbi:hypothetical protein DPMN_071269 [Dreissena polymorpha]|uniref:Uncharacterized protein n=1 Tax=Dreissena polymorpha TaxID=45954 RepID=A0A9D3Z2M6_DREPO|nr:hypothetical protein DPMN_071269 [Dreissena polymorpha]
MAESSFRLPSLLNVTDGNLTENFKKWKREFEVYMTATGSDKKDAKVRVAILCTVQDQISLTYMIRQREKTRITKTIPSRSYK